MPESSGSREGDGGGGGGSSRFARLLPPTHIQKVGTRLELEVEAKQDSEDGGGQVSPARTPKYFQRHSLDLAICLHPYITAVNRNYSEEQKNLG